MEELWRNSEQGQLGHVENRSVRLETLTRILVSAERRNLRLYSHQRGRERVGNQGDSSLSILVIFLSMKTLTESH